jgi:alkylhydroperoxidase/carboxymuconolactone decarboxylase family protein YurZ
MDAYTQGCISEGADEEQMMEAVHVAAAIRGGATLVNAVPMMNTLKAKLM